MIKDIIRVFSTNFFKIFVTFITAFVIPKILPVEDYGYLKQYQFYASYVGISHLGFCDGIYLKYGGKSIDEIDKRTLSKENGTLFIYELLVGILFLLYGVFKSNISFVCLGISVVPTVMATFYIYVFQATGTFKIYSRIINISTFFNLAVNLFLVFSKIIDFRYYIFVDCIVQSVIWLMGIAYFLQNGMYLSLNFSFDILFKNIKNGILLLIGNFVYSLFLGIDKWFINFSLPIEEFSKYSFAGQMVMIVNMFITPIAMTLYSNMSKRLDKQFEIMVKKWIIVCLMVIPIGICGIQFFVVRFIQNYANSINIISILLINQIFLAMNTALFVNLYKVYKKQKEYFIRLSLSLSIAVGMDFIVYFIKPNLYGYAMSTLISCCIWLGLNIIYFQYMKLTINELLYIFSLLAIFVFTIPFNCIMRILIYLVAYIIFTKIYMKDIWTGILKKM